jgi:hypothetical protein
MRRQIRVSLILVLTVGFADLALGADGIPAAEASKHLGEKAKVCGLVAGVHKAGSSKGTPTFVNLDKAYPHQVFTILIWGDDLSKFTPAPNTWEGKRMCATGVISSHQGVPEIVARETGQISLP